MQRDVSRDGWKNRLRYGSLDSLRDRRYFARHLPESVV